MNHEKGLADMGSLPPGPLAFVSVVNVGRGGINAILVIDSTGKVRTFEARARILDGPAGMAVTNNPPTLFVAQFALLEVLEYKSDHSVETLQEQHQPYDVAVDGRSDVAAINLDGTVACFGGGAKQPTRIISGGFSQLDWGAFDASGNLFVDGITGANATAIGEIIGGCQSGTAITTLTGLGAATDMPGGIQVADNGDIVVLDGSERIDGPIIDTYKLSGTSLRLESITPLLQAGNPPSIALTPGSNRVLTADAALTNANLYAYPSGGAPLKSVNLPINGTQSSPIGIAVYPSEQF